VDQGPRKIELAQRFLPIRAEADPAQKSRMIAKLPRHEAAKQHPNHQH
jgi:hypothetical protein